MVAPWTNQTLIDFTPDDTYVAPFKWELIDLNSCRQWMNKYWSLSVVASALYILLIHVGRQWMKNKSPFVLRRPVFVWNASLALFSLLGFIRLLPEVQYILSTDGFYGVVCERRKHSSVAVFWGWLFVWSKIVELGDTGFLVLRKKPVLFLHWYHHITVLLYCWITYADYEPQTRWYGTTNYLVHAVMYSYYAARTAQLKMPRSLAMCVTGLQLSQMVAGVTVTLYSLHMKVNKGLCTDNSYQNIYLAIGIYATYFVLFANFFIRAYFETEGDNLRGKKVE